MPDHLRRLVGALLLFAAIGVAAGQALLVSCSPATAHAGPQPWSGSPANPALTPTSAFADAPTGTSAGASASASACASASASTSAATRANQG